MKIWITYYIGLVIGGMAAISASLWVGLALGIAGGLIILSIERQE